MKALSFLVLLMGLWMGLASGSSAAVLGGDKRVALVIGNSAYKNAVALANPEHDARAVAAKLRQLGFIVVEGYDLTHEGMQDVVKDFSKAVRGADIGMFYYAGHGMQVNGKNYFVPVDAAFQDASALDFEAIPMDLILRQMQNDVAVRLVILDACRDNPLSQTLSRSMSHGSRSVSVAEGLAEVKINDPGEGTAIIFATSPDQVALDGDGDHSPFTTAFLDNIDSPDTDLQVVMSRITGEVYSTTKQQQRPWINASLTGDVFLNPKEVKSTDKRAPSSDTVKPVVNNSNTLERETALYNLARDSGQKEDYLAYLEVFPDGLYAVNARKQIERIDSGQSAKNAPEVASIDPAQKSGDTVRSVGEPGLQLPITDAVKAAPSNQLTEDALTLDKPKRTELQTRLTLAGFAINPPDGSFGNKTRKALQAWQSSRGLSSTGYLNQQQYEILMQQTESAFAAYVPPTNPVVTPAQPSGKSYRRRRDDRPSGNARRAVRRGVGASEDFGRFVGGVLRGVTGR